MKFNFENATPLNTEFRQADETWLYQEADAGDSVEGLLVGVRKIIPKKGPDKDPRNLYTIQDEDDRLIDVWGSAVIDNHLAELEPNKWGVKLVYEGKITPDKGGRPYHSFTVYKLPVEEAIDDVPEPEELGQ